MHLRRRWRGWCAPAMIGLAMATTSQATAQAVVIYVDPTATTGDDDGSTWANAYLTLEKALCNANPDEDGVEIRVRGASGTFDGVYVPSGDYTAGNDCAGCEIAQFTGRDAHFRLKHNVKIYGGFEGGEISGHDGLVQRVPKIRSDAHPTELSGTFGPDPDDHVYHVVASLKDCTLDSGGTARHYLDGVRIVGGWASGDGFGYPADAPYGGGLLRDNTELAVVLCTIEGNAAGELVLDGSGQIESVTPGAGGGMAVLGSVGAEGPPPLVDVVACTFRENFVRAATGSDAGAVGGGGIAIDDVTTNRVRIVNSLIHSNVVQGPFGSRGGGIALVYGAMDLYNCTIMDNGVDPPLPNTGTSRGGGIALSQAGSDATITNTIIWGNAADSDISVYQGGSTTLSAQGCDTEGGALSGSGNISANPNVDATYRLAAPSPCIDAGLNAPLTAIPDSFDLDKDLIADGTEWEVTPDRDIMPRIQNWCVDMGAYETLDPCATDLDGDMDTGFSDLLIVLSVWGPCSGACPADIDGSGDVGFGDLLLVLSSWGPCRTGAPTCDLPDTSTLPPQSIADCIAKIGLNHPDKLQACIEAMMLNGTP